MAFNDSLSDMLARINNAHKSNKSFTSCFFSKLNNNVLSVLRTSLKFFLSNLLKHQDN